MVGRKHDMAGETLTLFLADDAATARVGAALGTSLRPGDSVMLEGGLGAGKSALARAAITALLALDGRAEEIPSPTFSLVQVYDTARGAVWHVDLYRLSTPEEALELGLEAALESEIALVEWPDRLADQGPARRLIAHLDMPKDGEGRILTLTAIGADWTDALDAAREAA